MSPPDPSPIDSPSDSPLSSSSAPSSPPDSSLITRWGELLVSSSPPVRPSSDLARDGSRELKWLEMLQQWDNYSQSATLKRRIRKGIPDSLRAAIWPRVSLSNIELSHHTGLYASLLQQKSEFDDVIIRDIARTFPRHIIFQDEKELDSSVSQSDEALNSTGRVSLYNVLRAYACYNPKVGYTQGMGFIVGIFLMYFSEEESFWLLRQLMQGEKYQLAGLYMPGFPLLHEWFFIFSELMKEITPKCHLHLSHLEISPFFYATEWFMTLFSYKLPFDILLRVWDIFLYEGPKMLFRFALFIMKSIEPQLIRMDMDQINQKLKELQKEPFFLNLDQCIEASLKISIGRKQIRKLSQAYHQSIINKNK
jgi:hypothetical protein